MITRFRLCAFLENKSKIHEVLPVFFAPNSYNFFFNCDIRPEGLLFHFTCSCAILKFRVEEAERKMERMLSQNMQRIRM